MNSLTDSSGATLTADDCQVTHPVPDLDAFFANKEQYLREYRERQKPVIEAAKASWHRPEIEVLPELKRRLEPLLEESIYLAKGVGGPVRLDLLQDDNETVAESIVVDFPEKEVRAAADEKVRYRFRTLAPDHGDAERSAAAAMR